MRRKNIAQSTVLASYWEEKSKKKVQIKVSDYEALVKKNE